MRRARHRVAFIILSAWALLLLLTYLGQFGRGASPSDDWQQETARLQQQILSLQEQNNSLLKLQQLTAQYEANPFPGFLLLPCRISAPSDLSPRRRSATLEAGVAQGVGTDQGVIAKEGVVGKIASVDQESARVMLADDPGFRVHYVVAGSNPPKQGIAQGGPFAGEMTSLFREDSAPLEANELLVTAGEDGVFPAGILIGRVVDGAGNGEYQRISTALKLTAACEVVVLKSRGGAPQSK